MIALADSSVLIDWFNNRETAQTRQLRDLAASGGVQIGDLMIAEVLRGCDTDSRFSRIHAMLATFDHVVISDVGVAIEAARHYRFLRGKGVTVRGTIDTLIATRCIVDGLPLLFSDRDFQPFVDHLGLIDAMTLA